MNKNEIQNILFKLNIVPTEKQLEYWDAIKWLTSHDIDDAGSGRTTLLAMMFILQAIENPGTKLQLFDHYPCRGEYVPIIEIVESLLSKADYDFKRCFRISRINRTIEYILPEEIRADTPLEDAIINLSKRVEELENKMGEI